MQNLTRHESVNFIILVANGEPPPSAKSVSRQSIEPRPHSDGAGWHAARSGGFD